MNYEDTEIGRFSLSYVVEGPVVVNSDSDFLGPLWTGDGSATTPYTLQNLNITSNDACITIRSTSKHYMIKNCLLTSDTTPYNHGVYLEEAPNGTVRNCIIFDKNIGVYIEESPQCYVYNNTISDCVYGGMRVRTYSHNTVIANNTLVDNDAEGIDVWVSHNVIIENNTVTGQYQFGLWLENADSCVVKYNYIESDNWESVRAYHTDLGILANNTIITPHSTRHDEQYSIEIYFSSGWTIANNSVSGSCDSSIHFNNAETCVAYNNTLENGVCLIGNKHSEIDHILAGNEVKGKPLLFMKNIENASVDADAYGQVLLLDCLNVTVYNGEFNYLSSPLGMYYSSNCTFESSDIINSRKIGIHVYQSNYATIYSNNISIPYQDAIFVADSLAPTIANNSILNGLNAWNTPTAIQLSDSQGAYIENNTIMDNQMYGISLGESSSTVSHNVLLNNAKNDLTLTDSPNCEVMYNDLGNGITISGHQSEYWEHNFTGNTVNSKIISYLREDANISLTDDLYSQFIVVNCTNITVSDLQLSGISTPVAIAYSDNCTVRDSVLEALENGIFVEESTNCTLTKIETVGGARGIYLYNSEDCLISNSTLTDGVDYCLYVYGSFNITIQFNEMREGMYGIQAYSTSNSSFLYNFVHHCTTGLSLIFDSFNNTAYGNSLGYCTQNNGDDYGLDNSWDDGVSLGNGWSDYSGVGVYTISGTAYSVDHFPTLFIIDETVPNVHGSTDQWIDEGENLTLYWAVSDDHPATYEILVNGILNATGPWVDNLIRYDFILPGGGYYNITIIVYDLVGNFNSDTVFVTVRFPAAPTISHPPDMSYPYGDVGNSITWTVDDENREYYIIYKNGVQIEYDVWYDWKDTIQVGVDGYSVGEHNITLLISDGTFNTTDTVIVTVEEDSTTTTVVTTTTSSTATDTTTSTVDPVLPDFMWISMMIVGGSIGVVVLIIILAYQARKPQTSEFTYG